VLGKTKLQKEIRQTVFNILELLEVSCPAGLRNYDEIEIDRVFVKLKKNLASELAQAKHSVSKVDAQHVAAQYQALGEWKKIVGSSQKAVAARRAALKRMRSLLSIRILESSGASKPSDEVEREASKSQQLRRSAFNGIKQSCSMGNEWPGLYVLGCFDLKKTFHIQQRRAIALIGAWRSLAK
jgi:hypothetical protein